MSKFTGDLTITELALRNGRMWRLETPLVYYRTDTGIEITVNVGFQTDGATVPRFLWWMIPAWGTYSRAAVLHDRLLTWIGDGTPHPEATTRHMADNIFFEAMTALQVNPILKWALYIGVCIPTLIRKKPRGTYGLLS